MYYLQYFFKKKKTLTIIFFLKTKGQTIFTLQEKQKEVMNSDGEWTRHSHLTQNKTCLPKTYDYKEQSSNANSTAHFSINKRHHDIGCGMNMSRAALSALFMVVCIVDISSSTWSP